MALTSTNAKSGWDTRDSNCRRVARAGGLFGGALLMAGIATPQAVAQFDFSGGDSTAWVLARDNYGTTVFQDYENTAPPIQAGGFWNGDFISGSGYAQITPTSLQVDVSTSPGTSGFDGYAFSRALADRAIPDVDMTMNVLWDFQSDDSFNELYIYDNTLEQSIINHEGSGSGSQIVTFEAGHWYIIRMNAYSASEEPGAGSASITPIPAPGALALFGVASMVVRHRRRRSC